MGKHNTQLACALSVCIASAAAAQHAGDIFLAVEDDTIVTGAIDQNLMIAIPVRVFAAQFGDSGCAPFTANPGFDTLPGTFVVGTQLGWNAVEGMQVWNGNAFESIDTEFLEVSFVSQSFTVGDAPVAGFSLFVQNDGGFHRHLDFCMNGCPDGCTPPADADPGIYLLALEMYSTDPNLQTSDPFWIVFNYLDSSANHDAAIDWVVANLVDDPKCPADIVGNDGTIDVFDLIELLTNWATDGPGSDIAEPTDVVDVFDLIALLDAWGDCEP